jgi:hypothetical protein
MKASELWTDIQRRVRQTGSGRALLAIMTGMVCTGLVLCGCSTVNVVPLGSTSKGRQQFELTCNQRASDDGSCHQKALDACGGDYETLDVNYTGPRMLSYNGQLFTAPGQRVLLIACNPSRLGRRGAGLRS